MKTTIESETEFESRLRIYNLVYYVLNIMGGALDGHLTDASGKETVQEPRPVFPDGWIKPKACPFCGFWLCHCDD